MELTIIFWGLMVLGLAIVIYAIVGVRAEWLQHRRIQNGSVFQDGAWTPAPTKRKRLKGQARRDEKKAHKAAWKHGRALAHTLCKSTRAEFGVKLHEEDVAKLVAEGGALRLDASHGVRYDAASERLIKVGLHS